MATLLNRLILTTFFSRYLAEWFCFVSRPSCHIRGHIALRSVTRLAPQQRTACARYPPFVIRTFAKLFGNGALRAPPSVARLLSVSPPSVCRCSYIRGMGLLLGCRNLRRLCEEGCGVVLGVLLQSYRRRRIHVNLLIHGIGRAVVGNVYCLVHNLLCNGKRE